MIATRLLRRLDLADGHVAAASGLVRLGDFLHVVADDEHELAVFPRAGGAGRRLRLLPGQLPRDKAERKARKPDFEILLELPGRGLLAMGSGSRATRERAVLVSTDARGDAIAALRTIDLAPLHARLRASFPELNLEGALLHGDDFVLLQRASGKDPRNALLALPAAALFEALERGVLAACEPRIALLDLGRDGGLAWSVTDATALPDGDALVSAVLEDTCDAYADGPCRGSALASVGLDGTVAWFERLDVAAKVEGIALDGDEVLLVTDADDPEVPAQLLRCSPSPSRRGPG